MGSDALEQILLLRRRWVVSIGRVDGFQDGLALIPTDKLIDRSGDELAARDLEVVGNRLGTLEKRFRKGDRCLDRRYGYTS